MALTEVKGRSLGDQVAGGSWVIATVAGPGSYSNGNGFDADIATDLGVAVADIDQVIVTSTAGYTGAFDGTDKVIAYDGATEVADTTDLSSVTFELTIFVGLTAS